MPEIGHNSGGIAAEVLSQYVDRIERLNEEKAALAEDIKGVFDEAKATGFSVPVMRKIIAMRKKDEVDLREEQELLHLYSAAIGWSIFD